MVENPEGFHFDDLQLQTHADNDIEALVSLANMDGEKVEFNATGQGSVEAIFNAIDKFFNQSVRLVSYTIDAVTDGIDTRIGFWSLLKTEIQKPSLMQQGLILMC